MALPWIPHGGYAFLFAAKQLGYWSDRGLDVQVDRGFGSGDTCKRVALGQYDYGLADFATMVKLADDGLPLVCIGMVAHVSQLGILSSKKPISPSRRILKARRSVPRRAAPIMRCGQGSLPPPELTPTK